MDGVTAELKEVIARDRPEGDTYDVLGHFQVSESLMNINNQIITIAASNLHISGWSSR